MEEESKKIIITGTNNRYQIKKMINKKEKEVKKRVVSLNWNFPDEYYEYKNQFQMIFDISNNNLTHTNDVSKIVIQQINRKIYGYKQQDILKKILDNTNFITFECIINKMIDCGLKCYYCKSEMNVLYDISRENKQWSVDRIDNNKGHNFDNFHLACLECNLKRRCKTDDKFLFTKQLNIIKKNDDL